MKRPAQHSALVEVTSREELRAWVDAHHSEPGSIWLVTYKKADRQRYVPYEAIVEEALCYGWVDGLPRELHEQRTMHLLSPRKPKSAWSKVNKERAERLIAAGLMTEAGLAKIEEAKTNGAWCRLEEVEALLIPADLAAALSTFAVAHQNFENFSSSSKRLILEWISAAKRPETRAARIAETARLAAENIRANHYRQPASAGRKPKNKAP